MGLKLDKTKPSLFLGNGVEKDTWYALTKALSKKLALSVNTGIANDYKNCGILNKEITNTEVLSNSKLLFGTGDYCNKMSDRATYLNSAISLGTHEFTRIFNKKIAFIKGHRTPFSDVKQACYETGATMEKDFFEKKFIDIYKKYAPDIVITTEMPISQIVDVPELYPHKGCLIHDQYQTLLEEHKPDIWIVLNKYITEAKFWGYGKTIFETVPVDSYLILDLTTITT